MVRFSKTVDMLKANLYLLDELRKQVDLKTDLAQILAILLDTYLTKKQSIAYLQEKYQSQIPDWRTLTNLEVEQHAKEAIKFKQQRQWAIQMMKKQKQEQEMKDRKRIQENMKLENISVEQRIKQLNELIKKCEANMNLCKKEEQYLKYNLNYRQLRKELKMLKPSLKLKIRRKPIGEELDQDIVKLVNQMKQKRRTEQANHSISANMQNRRLNTHKLQKIYNYYSRKFSKGITFERIDDLNMSIKAFTQFVKDFELTGILNINQIYQIFKINSQFQKYISFKAFKQILVMIHRMESQRLVKESNRITQNLYIESKVLDQAKLDKILHLKAYNQKLFNYEFKVIAHTGKSKQQIMQEIRLRKQQMHSVNSPLLLHNKSVGKVLPQSAVSPQLTKNALSNRSTDRLKNYSTPSLKSHKRSIDTLLCPTKQSNMDIIEEVENDKKFLERLLVDDEDEYLSKYNEKKISFPNIKKRIFIF